MDVCELLKELDEKNNNEIFFFALELFLLANLFLVLLSCMYPPARAVEAKLDEKHEEEQGKAQHGDVYYVENMIISPPEETSTVTANVDVAFGSLLNPEDGDEEEDGYGDEEEDGYGDGEGDENTGADPPTWSGPGMAISFSMYGIDDSDEEEETKEAEDPKAPEELPTPTWGDIMRAEPEEEWEFGESDTDSNDSEYIPLASLRAVKKAYRRTK